MNVGMLFGKRTWIGFGVSVMGMITLLSLGALLVIKGVIPMNIAPLWLWISYGIAAMVGGRIAGKSLQACAFMPAGLLYIVAWGMALCSECEISFITNGVGITVAVLAGAIIAFLTSGKKKHKKSIRGKRPVPRSIRR